MADDVLPPDVKLTAVANESGAEHLCRGAVHCPPVCRTRAAAIAAMHLAALQCCCDGR